MSFQPFAEGSLGMERREYELIRKVQGHHWWWEGRRRIIKAVLDRHLDRSRPLNIADIGSGYGANIPLLLRYGEVTALESDTEALAHIGREYAGRVRTLRWQSPEPLEMRFDLMLLADVLEHFPDDAGVAQWIWDHLAEGGQVMITVPAHQFLWTEMDEVVHHFRRYSRDRLHDLFSKLFEIQVMSYYNMLLFPVKVAFVGFARGLRKLAPNREKRSYNDVPPTPINAAFRAILGMESWVIPHQPLPFGVSLVLLARRPPAAA
jgi:SAM-dependent methyltransferase